MSGGQNSGDFSLNKAKTAKMISALCVLLQYKDGGRLIKAAEMFEKLQARDAARDNLSVHDDGIYDLDNDCLMKNAKISREVSGLTKTR